MYLSPIEIISKEITETFENDIFKYVQAYEISVSKDELIRALEKQKPVEPPQHDLSICPICNSKWNYGIPYTSYCCHCGQAIKRSDTND